MKKPSEQPTEGDHVWFCQTMSPAVIEGDIIHVEKERGRTLYHIRATLSHRVSVAPSSIVFTNEKAAMAKLRLNVYHRLQYAKTTVRTLEDWLEVNKEVPDEYH